MVRRRVREGGQDSVFVDGGMGLAGQSITGLASGCKSLFVRDLVERNGTTGVIVILVKLVNLGREFDDGLVGIGGAGGGGNQLRREARTLSSEISRWWQRSILAPTMYMIKSGEQFLFSSCNQDFRSSKVVKLVISYNKMAALAPL